MNASRNKSVEKEVAGCTVEMPAGQQIGYLGHLNVSRSSPQPPADVNTELKTSVKEKTTLLESQVV